MAYGKMQGDADVTDVLVLLGSGPQLQDEPSQLHQLPAWLPRICGELLLQLPLLPYTRTYIYVPLLDSRNAEHDLLLQGIVSLQK